MHHLTLQFQIRVEIMDASKFAFQIYAFTSDANTNLSRDTEFYSLGNYIDYYLG